MSIQGLTIVSAGPWGRSLVDPLHARVPIPPRVRDPHALCGCCVVDHMIATMDTMTDGYEEVTVTSQQLSNPLPKGVVAWIRGYTNSSCTGSGAEEQCFMTEC